MTPLLFVFLDGVGLGTPDPEVNPFAAARTPFLAELLGGPLDAERSPADGRVRFRTLDATLDHPGLPQSATGQTTLLTGLNGADAMAGHYGPWPGPTLKALLSAGTLFHEVVAAGGRAQLANIYPPGYFNALEGRALRVNVPVFAARDAGLRLWGADDYRRGRGLAADLSGAHLARLEPAQAPLSPREAGARLVATAAEADFTFFDFWLSDRIGHRGSFAEAVELVERLDAFLEGVFTARAELTLLVTSDHGNLEDKGVRGHTRAPVPLLASGPGAGAFAAVDSLLGVAPAVRRALALADAGGA